MENLWITVIYIGAMPIKIHFAFLVFLTAWVYILSPWRKTAHAIWINRKIPEGAPQVE